MREPCLERTTKNNDVHECSVLDPYLPYIQMLVGIKEITQ
jgi:hypothetical protein